ncbi:hypothetical protein RQP46_005469 [Phenoliferia psychrophenolica]
MRRIFLFTLLSLLGAVSSKLTPPMFKTFPVGTIKPTGWALDQATIQANGLAGSLAEWYEFVSNSTWTGGTVEYSAMDEAAPYWFNGIVPLAFQLDDAKLKKQVKAFLDYMLDHQQADGWLGPDGPDRPRLIWPRYLALFGLMQYAEADPSETTRIVAAMHRRQDIRYPEGKEAELLETMTIARDTGASWKQFFTDDVFPKGVPAVDDLMTNVFGMESNYPCCTVNFPQGFPKFWANSFVEETSSGALVHALLGPAAFAGTLESGNKVSVTVDTTYPFGSTLRYIVKTARPLTFKIRVPGWALATSTSTVEGRTSRLNPDSSTSLQSFSVISGGTSITVDLAREIRIEPRSNGSVAVHHGPLLYAVIWSPGLSRNATEHLSRGTRAGAVACEIVWNIVSQDADWPPQSPNQCTGSRFNVTLVPFGGTRLRIGELPTM